MSAFHADDWGSNPHSSIYPARHHRGSATGISGAFRLPTPSVLLFSGSSPVPMVRTDPWSTSCPNRQAKPDCRSMDTGVHGRDDQLPSRQCRERGRSASPPQPDAPRTRTRRYGGAKPCHDDVGSDSSSCRRSGRLLFEDGGWIDRQCPSDHPTVMLGEVRGNAGSVTGRSTRKPPSTEKDPEY